MKEITVLTEKLIRIIRIAFQVAYGVMCAPACLSQGTCLHCVTPRTDICYWTVDMSITYLVRVVFTLS